MLRGKKAPPRPPAIAGSKVEQQPIAEEFVDRLLDPTTPWFRQYWLASAPYRMASRRAITKAGFRDTLIGTKHDRDFNDALEKMDRQRMVTILTRLFGKDPISGEEARILFQIFEPSFWRRMLNDITHNPGPMFQVNRGPKPKIPRRDYQKLAAWSDKLFPVIFEILREQELDSQHTLEEILKHWNKKHTAACGFLLHHVARLRLALRDSRLKKRAKTNCTLARVIADALAGSELQVKVLYFITSHR